MAGRRTRGVAVDYRALDGADSDDDFNVPTPPTKRPRQKASERAAEFADGAGPSHGRLSLDDKLFKKQMKIALEQSRSDCRATSDSSSQEEHSIKSADTLPVPQDEMLESPRNKTKREGNVSQDSADQDEWAADAGSSSDDSEESGDDSSFSDDEFKPQPKKAAKKPVKAKKAATPKAKPAPSRRASPAKSVAVPGVPSEPGGPPALKAVSPVRRPPPGSGPPPLTRPVLKAVNAAPGSPNTGRPAPVKAARPSASSPRPGPAAPVLPSGRNTPKWKPPARISDAGSSEKRLMSPSGGGLRLGLSRNVRRKPLHPSAKPIT